MIRQLGRLLREQEKSLHEVSTEDYDSIAETLVAAALDGNPEALQVIARVLDE